MTPPTPLPKLPAAITRGQFLQALEVLGLDPAQLLSVRLHLQGVEIDVYALNSDGQRHLLGGNAWRPAEQDRDYDRVATHRVCIPVVPGTASPATGCDEHEAEASP